MTVRVRVRVWGWIVDKWGWLLQLIKARKLDHLPPNLRGEVGKLDLRGPKGPPASHLPPLVRPASRKASVDRAEEQRQLKPDRAQIRSHSPSESPPAVGGDEAGGVNGSVVEPSLPGILPACQQMTLHRSQFTKNSTRALSVHTQNMPVRFQ